MAFDASGNALAVWRRSNGTNDIVQSAFRPAGSAFGAPIDLSAAGRDAKEPQVAFDASGKALVVWDRFNGSCAAGRPRKHQQRCTRMVARGSFTHQDAADAVKVHFSGRVQGRKLTPGRYLLALTPTANGQAGRTVRLAFRIIR